MKACTMMGMKTIPFASCYRVNWYGDSTHRADMKSSLKDKYTQYFAKYIGRKIVEEAKNSDRKYGVYSSVV